jgi:hypothetical protein
MSLALLLVFIAQIQDQPMLQRQCPGCRSLFDRRPFWNRMYGSIQRRFRRAIDWLCNSGAELHFTPKIGGLHFQGVSYALNSASMTQCRIRLANEYNEISAFTTFAQMFLDDCYLSR